MDKVITWLCVISLLLALFGLYHDSHAAENTSTQQQTDVRIVWQRAPIKITLPVGRERFVTFPQAAQFGYNVERLPSSVLRVENDNQTLYLLAKQPFDTQRVQAKLTDGEIILLDLDAKIKADIAPIDIVLPEKPASDQFNNNNTSTIDYVTLTRFAVQQLYAPKRLLNTASDITRFPLEASNLTFLYASDAVNTTPLASWRGHNLYVTAIQLKNKLKKLLHVDPRLFCGHWQAASIYPRTALVASGINDDRDRTTLFIVSNQPFSEAIQSCLNRE